MGNFLFIVTGDCQQVALGYRPGGKLPGLPPRQVQTGGLGQALKQRRGTVKHQQRIAGATRLQ